MRRFNVSWAWIAVAGAAGLFPAIASAQAVTYGPSQYLSFADSPFQPLSFTWFHLEDFEDHLLNTPGVTGQPGGVASVVFGPSIHDSVDADDGSIDGSGLAGDDWFSSAGSSGVNFIFDAAVLGSLPTHAGIVWTDGAGTVSFQAFGPGDVPIAAIGPVSDASFPDGSFSGTTAEDRFFGVEDAGGISRIFISNSSGGIEVDHLQYGRAGVAPPPTAIPLPPAVWSGLSALGILGLGAVRRRI